MGDNPRPADNPWDRFAHVSAFRCTGGEAIGDSHIPTLVGVRRQTEERPLMQIWSTCRRSSPVSRRHDAAGALLQMPVPAATC